MLTGPISNPPIVISTFLTLDVIDSPCYAPPYEMLRF